MPSRYQIDVKMDSYSILPSTMAILSTVLFLGAFYLYRWLLPKPIPGIPYNKKAVGSILGDIPEMLEHLKHSKTVTDWFLGHVRCAAT